MPGSAVEQGGEPIGCLTPHPGMGRQANSQRDRVDVLFAMLRDGAAYQTQPA